MESNKTNQEKDIEMMDTDEDLESENFYAKARSQLQLSAIPESLPGRDIEKQDLETQIKKTIETGESRCICEHPFSFLNNLVLKKITLPLIQNSSNYWSSRNG